MGVGIKRVVIIVLDSLGIGVLPDAGLFGDEGSHTLGNISKALGGLSLPVLSSLGLGNIEGVFGVEEVREPRGFYGRMKEVSGAKDTTTGHLEMCGVVQSEPQPTFPGGFSEEILEGFTRLTGYGYLWAKPASGTEIIERLGAEHVRTGKPIVYTSADSVFQIAAHEDVIAIDELYRICEVTRAFLDEFKVGRVIARPFIGEEGGFTRTARRRDYTLMPPEETVLEALQRSGVGVTGIGKIGDIFAHRGITKEIHTSSNADGMERTLAEVEAGGAELVFTNLVDFDMLYGHRNDPTGYGRALGEFDEWLALFTGRLEEDDLLIITADHGCDPTTASTDHSREYVPLLAYVPGRERGGPLGTRESFADLGATLAEIFSISSPARGVSFLSQLGGL